MFTDHRNLLNKRTIKNEIRAIIVMIILPKGLESDSKTVKNENWPLLSFFVKLVPGIPLFRSFFVQISFG